MEAWVIAWDRVAELREEVGEQDFAEVVDLFLDEVEDTLSRLRGGAQIATLESDLHFVKGSALTLGFAQLGAVCEAGERDAAAARFDKVDIGAVLATYEASKAEFMDGLR
jgi:HPt (histidine-containing phosphotransfer) domain-containing protein